MSNPLLIEKTDGVGIITLNRPESLNAFTAKMAQDLAVTVQDFERDADVRCVLFRGNGDSFCAGADVKGFLEDLAADREGHAAGMEQRVVSGHLSFHRLRRMDKPVIVATHGKTAGMGISLMCAADLCLASSDASYILAYRHVGLSLDGGVSFFLPRIVGVRRAMEMALLGESFSATEARDWGLVNRMVGLDALQDEALELAKRIASGPTYALGRIKRLLNASIQNSWDEQSALEAQLISETVGSDDHFEGVTAFAEKRRAAFTGK